MSSPLIWIIFTFPLLILLERGVHQRLRGFFYLITGSRRHSLTLYSIILLPGVFLHELSHWLLANLFGIRTGNFSIIPSEDDYSTTLGYVEYYRTPTLDPVREGLVGMSPLFAGIPAVIFIARRLFNTPEILALIQTADLIALIQAGLQSFQSAEAFLWMWVLFAVSNSMMPSSADRRAWPLLFLALGVMVGTLYLLGAFPIIINKYGDSASRLFSYIALAFSITIIIDMIAIVVLFFLEKLYERVTGYRIYYQ